jgi:hypothetical protein
MKVRKVWERNGERLTVSDVLLGLQLLDTTIGLELESLPGSGHHDALADEVDDDAGKEARAGQIVLKVLADVRPSLLLVEARVAAGQGLDDAGVAVDLISVTGDPGSDEAAGHGEEVVEGHAEAA